MDKQAGMTGPEHHLAGEEALSRSETINLYDQGGMDRATLYAAQAQAHFAAAQVAAIGAAISDSDVPGASQQWAALLGIESDSKADGE